MMAQFMAIGLSPDKAIIFRQSSVAAHSQLHWILSNYAPIGHLKRMTQFKSRGGNNGLSLGIFSYPVLQAADILLYNTEGVPVGHDQLQHLELSRQIATSFNHLVDGQLFTVPEPIAGRIPRVMSLRDGLKKMSKSDPSAMSRIHITDNNDEIKLKIRKATTDSIGNISYDESQRPEISNLVRIMAELTDQAPEQVCEKFDGCTTVQFKDQLTERLIELITPMRDTYHRVRADQAYLNHIFASNADRANVQAERTLARVHTALGLAPLETETVLPNRNLSYSKPAFD
uniref:tryptophan--tRNA ligase n=3 Tax=Spongospora subterranea TaxID=70186 RepID=A0A0H5QHE6_9EUKA|eukprot:CRZ00761.1 hypothetical protein [Spongospora subterranea]